MGTLLKVASNFTAGQDLSGYLPSLGAPGYVDRHRASKIAGTVGNPVADGATWPSDIGGNALVIAKSGTNPPNPGLVDKSGLRFTQLTGGITGWAGPDLVSVTDKTYVLRILGVPTNGYFFKGAGFILASISGGWALYTRNAGGTPTQVLTLTGATNTPDAVYVVVLSISAAGAVRLSIKKNLDAPVVGTASGLTRGTDLSFRLGSPAYGSATSSHSFAGFVEWNRVLSTNEEAAVFAALAVQGANILAQDSFNRADSAANALGTADTGQSWTINAGTGWAVSNNQLISPTAASALAYIGALAIDCDAQITMASALNANLQLLLVGRFTDANNFVALQLSTTTLTIIQRISGTSTTLATYTLPSAPAVGDVYKLRMSADTLTAYRSGTQVASGTTTKLTGNGVGLRTSGTGGAGTAWRVDDLTVSPL